MGFRSRRKDVLRIDPGVALIGFNRDGAGVANLFEEIWFVSFDCSFD